MRVISAKILRDFWKSGYADAKKPLKQWCKDVETISILTPQDIKNAFSAASFLGDDRIVFNIAGIEYRLVVHANFRVKVFFIRFIWTHAQYDKIDVMKV